MACWFDPMNDAPLLSSHVAVVFDSIIMTIGGHWNRPDLERNAPIDLFVLDSENFIWSKLNYNKDLINTPSQRYCHTAVAYNNSVYIWGGFSNGIHCNSLYTFNVETEKWLKPSMHGIVPPPTVGHSACVVGNKMYVFGGYQPSLNKLSHDVYILDMDTITWSKILPKGSVPISRDFHTATVIGDKMYIFGGRFYEISSNGVPNNPEFYTKTVYYLNTTDNTWVVPNIKSNPPTGRCDHSAFEHNGKMHIFGGYNKSIDTIFNDIEQYDPVECVWIKLSTRGVMPLPRRMQMCIMVNDKVFISGGTTIPIGPHNTLQRYGMDLNNNTANIQNYGDLHVLCIKPTMEESLSVIATKNAEFELVRNNPID